MHKRVGFISHQGHDSICSPLLNAAEYLSSVGFFVDIFSIPQPYFGAPVFHNRQINYTIINVNEIGTIRKLWRFYFIKIVYLVMKKSKYDFIVGYDPRAFQTAYIIGRLLQIPVVFHSLEFYPEKTAKQKIERFLEKIFLRKADWIITQDPMRADWLSRKLNYPIEKISVIYNTSYGDYLPQKSDYLRNKFNISKDKLIVLAVGSLIKEHMILEIIDSVSEWPQDFVLVIHGWFPHKEYEKAVEEHASKYPGRIFISKEFLAIDRKYEIFQSADIGLVVFRPDNENNLLVGAAAGKLFEFARCGVPIVINDLPGMRTLVEDLCGEVCGALLQEIALKIIVIKKNYEKYRQGCERFYNTLSFAKMYNDFLYEFLSSKNSFKNRRGF